MVIVGEKSSVEAAKAGINASAITSALLTGYISGNPLKLYFNTT